MDRYIFLKIHMKVLHITWREVKKRHLIGYDLDDKIEIEIIRDINTKAIIVILEKDR